MLRSFSCEGYPGSGDLDHELLTLVVCILRTLLVELLEIRAPDDDARLGVHVRPSTIWVNRSWPLTGCDCEQKRDDMPTLT